MTQANIPTKMSQWIISLSDNKIVLLLLINAGLLTIPFSLIALRQRLEELEKGELDEARRY